MNDLAVLKTTGSSEKSGIQASGKTARPIPITPPSSAEIPAPTQPICSARSNLPAPTLIPTSDVMAAPIPKISADIRNSMREPIPYPASASGPKRPTIAVSTRMVVTVDTGDRQAGRATRPMSTVSRWRRSNWESLSLMGVFPHISLDSMTMLITEEVTTTETAAPNNPN